MSRTEKVLRRMSRAAQLEKEMERLQKRWQVLLVRRTKLLRRM